MTNPTPFRKRVSDSLLKAAKRAATAAREDRDDGDHDGHRYWTGIANMHVDTARKVGNRDCPHCGADTDRQSMGHIGDCPELRS